MIEDFLGNPITIASLIISVASIGFGIYVAVTNGRLLLLGLKSLRRNLLRTLLTAAATAVLVLMVTLIWTILFGLEQMTRERARDLKVIVTERWAVPSQLPMTHAEYLRPGSPAQLPELRGMYGPDDFMLWSFYGGTMDPAKRDPANLVFFFAMDPESIIPMMDDMEGLDPELIRRMRSTPQGCLIGRDKLAAIGNKQVGDRFKLSSINYKDLDLEFEVVGILPEGRWSQSAVMNLDYFNRAFDEYARARRVPHPLSDRRLNLIWIRVKDADQFDRLGGAIENSSMFSARPVKVERASAIIGSFLESYSTLIWAMKWLVVPAILAVMALVTANAISISVRERRTEMAVMKVLGFRPSQVFQLVLGEALLVGGGSGFGAALATFVLFNGLWGGIPFRLGFIPIFRIPSEAALWGLAIGAATAFLGSVVPSWSARSVKVSEVFSKVA